MITINTPIAEAKLQIVKYEAREEDDDLIGWKDGYFLGIFNYSSVQYTDSDKAYQKSMNYALIIDKETGSIIYIRVDRDRGHERIQFVIN